MLAAGIDGETEVARVMPAPAYTCWPDRLAGDVLLEMLDRAFRPAIWLAMLGLALVLLISPPYIGAVFIGAAIGLAIRIQQRRRRNVPASPTNRK